MAEIYNQYLEFKKMCDMSNYSEAEKLLEGIIVDVICKNDRELIVNRTTKSHDMSFDYIGQIRDGEHVEDIAIDMKFSRNKLSLDRISALLVSAMATSINNIILVSNSELTARAKEVASTVSQKEGINFQVFGRSELDSWFSTYEKQNQFINNNSVYLIIKEMSRELAKRVAMNPEEFMDLEWRDLERIIATIFSDFGYDVELTPSSKDGGKDVIVWCKGESFIIEIKHWHGKNKVGQRYISDFLKVVIRVCKEKVKQKFKKIVKRQ